MKVPILLWFFAVAAVHGEQAILAASSSVSAAPSLTLIIQTPTTQIHSTAIATALSRVMNSGQVRDTLKGTSHRLLHLDNLREPNEKNERNSFRAVVADYTNNRTIYVDVADGLGSSFDASVGFSNTVPLPSSDELAEAAMIAGFGSGAHVQMTMPGVLHEHDPNGSRPRILAIRAAKNGTSNFEQYHVNMNNRTATRIEYAVANAMPTCNAKHKAGAIDRINPTPGTAHVIVKDNQGQTIWELEVVRPGGSSGTVGSGVELLNVRYKNKLVLKQAHLPILNVNYLETAAGCGPTYRDWINEEFPFGCENPNGDAIPGFRQCMGEGSKTFSDRGDVEGFHGVSFDVRNPGVRIRSQLRAGWYRYVSEWTLYTNGRISPRWHFGGVTDDSSNCVCVKHHHHAYWRFDFDIETSKQNQVSECTTPTACQPQAYTRQFTRDDTVKKSWTFMNTQSQRGYRLVPGEHDRRANLPDDKSGYGTGDLWLTKASAPVDDYCAKYDGQWPPVGEDCTRANFNCIMGQAQQSTAGQDLVLWYSASFMHHEDHDAADVPHIVGPDLIPLGTW